MSVSLRRGAVGLAFTALVAGALAPAAHADNLDTDGLVSGAASLGDVCRGTTKNASVGFVLKRSGGINNQTWANSAHVTVGPTTQPAPLTLGTSAATTLSNWTSAGNNASVDAGDPSVSLTVPADAALGVRTAEVTYAATGRGAAVTTTTRTTIVTFSWNVVDCTPADTTPPVITQELTPATPEGANGWYRTDVAVDWTVSDPQSAVTTVGCADVAYATDGTFTSTCSASSAGGSAGPASVTVKRDVTPPSLEPVVSGELGEDDWYVGDVAVSWTASDATSGVDPATACAPATLAEDTMGETFSCTVRDLAGNAASASVTVKRDATDPVVVETVSGTLGDNGWYTSDVDVSFDVSDATSSIASAVGCEDVTLAEDSSGETYTCTATDGAGHSASATVEVKRDATAPDVTFTRTGAEGTNGWFTGPVVLDWTTSDGLAGLASTQGCVDRTVSTDGRHTFPCSSTDAAGNIATAEAFVDLDATAPVVTPVLAGEKKGTDWFTGDVTVEWDVTDATSGEAERVGCEPATVTADTDGTTFGCSVTDAAGNRTDESTMVRRDATAPDITPQAVGTRSGEWFTGDVSVTWTITDETSGVATSTGCAPVTVAVDTSGQVLSCSGVDEAGNEATRSTTVKRDATAPVITPDVQGPKSGTDWFTGDATVAWTVTDATSGVADRTGCGTTTVNQDTTGTTFTCSAVDVAGNASTRSITVKRDATAPTLTLVGGPADGATYDFGDVPAASTCTASDATSGLAGLCSVTAGGTAVGSRTQVATATDQAGNVTTRARSYTVAAWRLDGFYKPVAMGTTVVNTVKAGSTVPLKFNVYKGSTAMTADIGARFTTSKVGCDGGDAEDPIELVTTGSTSLRYDAAAGQWVQNWATPSGGKGSCYRVTMTTADGSAIVADFKLK